MGGAREAEMIWDRDEYRAWRARVEEAQRAPRPMQPIVSQWDEWEHLLENASREELVQRLRNQRTFIQAYAESLDGLDLPKTIPGSGLDGHRTAQNIRAIVKFLMG